MNTGLYAQLKKPFRIPYTKVMTKYPPKEEYVYRDLHIGLSTKRMANVLYACLMCHAAMTNSYCLCYEYTRKQNAYNTGIFKIHIHPSYIPLFEETVECKLKTPQTVSTSGGRIE